MRWAIIFILSMACASACVADGGQLHATASTKVGQLSVFASFNPTVDQPLEIKALVQDSTGHPTRTARVVAWIDGPQGQHLELDLVPERSDGPGMYAARVTPPTVGQWHVAVTATLNGRHLSAECVVEIQPAAPALAQRWPWLLPVPAGLLLWVACRRRPSTLPT